MNKICKLSDLIVTEAYENNVGLVDPHFFPELAANVTKPLDPVKTHGLESPITQHLGHLRHES